MSLWLLKYVYYACVMPHYGSRQLIMLKFTLSYLAQPFFKTTKLKNGPSESVRLVLCTVCVHSKKKLVDLTEIWLL